MKKKLTAEEIQKINFQLDLDKAIKTMKADLRKYNLYMIADSIPYGDYQLTVTNYGNSLTYAIENDKGMATNTVDKSTFLNLDVEHIMKMFDQTLYYNWISSEE